MSEQGSVHEIISSVETLLKDSENSSISYLESFSSALTDLETCLARPASEASLSSASEFQHLLDVLLQAKERANKLEMPSKFALDPALQLLAWKVAYESGSLDLHRLVLLQDPNDLERVADVLISVHKSVKGLRPRDLFTLFVKCKVLALDQIQERQLFELIQTFFLPKKEEDSSEINSLCQLSKSSSFREVFEATEIESWVVNLSRLVLLKAVKKSVEEFGHSLFSVQIIENYSKVSFSALQSMMLQLKLKKSFIHLASCSDEAKTLFLGEEKLNCDGCRLLKLLKLKGEAKKLEVSTQQISSILNSLDSIEKVIESNCLSAMIKDIDFNALKFDYSRLSFLESLKIDQLSVDWTRELLIGLSLSLLKENFDILLYFASIQVPASASEYAFRKLLALIKQFPELLFTSKMLSLIESDHSSTQLITFIALGIKRLISDMDRDTLFDLRVGEEPLIATFAYFSGQFCGTSPEAREVLADLYSFELADTYRFPLLLTIFADNFEEEVQDDLLAWLESRTVSLVSLNPQFLIKNVSNAFSKEGRSILLGLLKPKFFSLQKQKIKGVKNHRGIDSSSLLSLAKLTEFVHDLFQSKFSEKVILNYLKLLFSESHPIITGVAAMACKMFKLSLIPNERAKALWIVIQASFESSAITEEILCHSFKNTSRTVLDLFTSSIKADPDTSKMIAKILVRFIRKTNIRNNFMVREFVELKPWILDVIWTTPLSLFKIFSSLIVEISKASNAITSLEPSLRRSIGILSKSKEMFCRELEPLITRALTLIKKTISALQKNAFQESFYSSIFESIEFSQLKSVAVTLLEFEVCLLLCVDFPHLEASMNIKSSNLFDCVSPTTFSNFALKSLKKPKIEIQLTSFLRAKSEIFFQAAEDSDKFALLLLCELAIKREANMIRVFTLTHQFLFSYPELIEKLGKLVSCEPRLSVPERRYEPVYFLLKGASSLLLTKIVSVVKSYSLDPIAPYLESYFLKIIEMDELDSYEIPVTSFPIPIVFSTIWFAICPSNTSVASFLRRVEYLKGLLRVYEAKSELSNSETSRSAFVSVLYLITYVCLLFFNELKDLIKIEQLLEDKTLLESFPVFKEHLMKNGIFFVRPRFEILERLVGHCEESFEEDFSKADYVKMYKFFETSSVIKLARLYLSDSKPVQARENRAVKKKKPAPKARRCETAKKFCEEDEDSRTARRSYKPKNVRVSD